MLQNVKGKNEEEKLFGDAAGVLQMRAEKCKSRHQQQQQQQQQHCHSVKTSSARTLLLQSIRT